MIPLALKPFLSKALPYAAIVATVAAYGWAAYSWGWNAREARVQKDRGDGLEAALDETEARLKAANAIEQKAETAKTEIRYVRVKADFDPDGCKPDDIIRMRHNARTAERDALARGSPPVPDGVPGRAAHEPN